MKEYKKIVPEVIVGLGDDTKFLEKQPPFITVLNLHIDLEDWLGDDLMECHPCYIATEQLKNALESSEYTGFEFAEMVVRKGEYFKDNYHLKKSLPKFYWMKIIGKENIDDLYISDKGYLMSDSNAIEFIRKDFNHKYLDVDLEEDVEQQEFLKNLLERAKQRNNN